MVVFMTLKLKLSSAVALVILASNASANTFISNTGATSPSDLLLAIQDNTTQNTFILDLTTSSAINYTSVVNGTAPASYTWDLTSNGYFNGSQGGLATFVGHSLTWGVVGEYANQSGNTTTNGVQWGELLTGAAATDFIVKNAGKINTDTVTGGATYSWFNTANSALGTGPAISLSASDTNSFANTFSTYFPQVVSQSVSANSDPIANSGSAGLYYLTSAFTTGTKAVTNTLEGTFTLSANDQLTYTSTSTAAVPLPAGVWLFLSGLVAMLGLNRQKQTAVNA